MSLTHRLLFELLILGQVVLGRIDLSSLSNFFARGDLACHGAELCDALHSLVPKERRMR